jgi:Spy/CpxP family protein refolding chaperone
MKKRLVFATTMIAALALTGAAFAHGGGGPRGRGGMGGGIGMKLMRAVKHLDLTEEQEVKAVRLRRQMREERQAGKLDHQAMMKDVAAELRKERPDARKLHGIADQVIARMTKMTHSAIDRFLELHATFSPDQRAKLGEMTEKRANRKGKRGRRGFDVE